LSENGKGNAEDIIEFDTLDLDEYKSGPNKITELQSFLKESLEPDKYSEAMKILGINEDMTNTQLLEAITLLVKKKKEDEEEDEEDKEDKEKKAAKKPEEEEEEEEKKTAAPTYKDFMEKCMKAGKSMADCAKEFKEKYPAPKEKEESEIEQLAESEWKEEIDLARKKKKDEYEYPEKKAALPPEVRKELDDLKLELSHIKEEKRLMEITHKVDEQIQEKHLAPKQRDHVIKLMSKLEDTHHDELLATFATQKFKGFEDVGQSDLRRPGETQELDEETRMKLMKEHGIADLIEEKGMKRRAS